MSIKEPSIIPGGKRQYVIQGQTFDVTKKFTITKIVGSGAYGTVCAAVDTSTTMPVAIKKISKVFDDLIDCKRILRELKVLAFVKHTNLLHLHEYIRPNTKDAFNELYVVTDLYDSDLHRIIKSQQPLSNQHLQYFLVQAFRGLHHLHSANILHRDLKPSNILINANCDIAICDFGLARGDSSGKLTEYVVTRWYRPPELLSLASTYTTAIDMWSMGLIFAELLHGRTLLPGKDYVAQLKLVIELLGTPTMEEMECLSPEARKFILAMPKREPQNMNNLFPKASPEALDMIRQLLQFHPARRPTTKQIFDHPFLAAFRDPHEEADAPEKFTFSLEEVDTPASELRELIWEEVTKHSDELDAEPEQPTPAPLIQA